MENILKKIYEWQLPKFNEVLKFPCLESCTDIEFEIP